ncbi:RNA recognition motif domain-containing protein [Ditylenchus destructor]|nr:RNA recognition motif domain-containing protein [Ditylenchus destructor]
MISRSRLLICLRNVSISRHHLCALSSTQFSVQIPNNSLIQQDTKMRCFSSFREIQTEFPSSKSNKNSQDIIHSHSDEYIFSSKRHFDDNRTIFVGGLSRFTTVQSLYKHFLQYGTITGCKLARHKHNGVSKEYGFVEFDLVEQAESTCEYHPHVIDDKEVNAEMRSHKELRNKFTFFIGGLSKQTSVETLRKYFSKFGQIAECAIPRNEVNGSRGFGYVAFKSQEAVDIVLNSTPHHVDDKSVDVKLAETRQREYTLFVGKLSPNTTNESLNEFYSRFGRLTQCNVKLESQTGQSRGFGFVAFTSQEDLDSALYAQPNRLNSALEVQPHVIDGTEVEINYVTMEFEVAVTSLSPDITEEALHEHFSRYGELQKCEIKETSPGARTGFVGFHSQKDLLQAMADRPHKINGKMVNTHQKDQSFNIYVGNLPSDATDDSLFKTFSKYGKIVHWHVKRDRHTNRPLGYGFVSFEKAEEAIQALSGGTELNGRALRVEPGKTLPLSKKSFK